MDSDDESFFGQLGIGKMNRKPGDWTCRSCQHLNFSRRDSCQRCGNARARPSIERSELASFGCGGARGGSSSFGFRDSDVQPGDWYCSCGAHNFASRSSCFNCGGGGLKDESAVGSGGFDGDLVPLSRGLGFGFSGGWKSGDWICNRYVRSGSNEHNFAGRMECSRCSAPGDSGTQV